MKNYLIIVFMWFNLVTLVITLSFLKIPIISKVLILGKIDENASFNISFIYKNEDLIKPKSVYFFNEKGKKIWFKDYLEVKKEEILVQNNNNYELPKNLTGFVYSNDETILNYVLKSIF